MHNLNLRTKTIKLLEENKEVNIHDLGIGNGFLDMTPINKRKEQMNSALKDIINKVKTQPTEWEEIFPTYISYKDLVSRIHFLKNLLQVNNKKINR